MKPLTEAYARIGNSNLRWVISALLDCEGEDMTREQAEAIVKAIIGALGGVKFPDLERQPAKEGSDAQWDSTDTPANRNQTCDEAGSGEGSAAGLKTNAILGELDERWAELKGTIQRYLALGDYVKPDGYFHESVLEELAKEFERSAKDASRAAEFEKPMRYNSGLAGAHSSDAASVRKRLEELKK